MIAPDSLLLLLAAIIIDAYAGSPMRRAGWRWQPGVAMERAARGAAAKLDRPRRGARALRVRGAVAAAALALGAAAGGLALEAMAAAQPLFSVFVLFVFAGAIDQRDSADAARDLERALARGDEAGAMAAFGRLSARDPASLDDRGLARVGVEALMRRLSRRWTAPVLYAAAAGVPGVAAYWLIDGLAAPPGRGAFGAAPRALRRGLRWLPDLIAGAALAAVSGAPRRGFAALRGAPGADWPASAAASALGLALGGPRRYAGRTVERAWIGRGRTQAGPADLAAAGRLHARAVALLAAGVCAAGLIRLFEGG